MNRALDTAAVLVAVREEVAAEATRRLFDLRAEDGQRRAQAERDRCTEDGRRHLDYLGAAVRWSDPGIFVEYVDWSQVLLQSTGSSTDELRSHLRAIQDIVTEHHSEVAPAVVGLLAAGFAALDRGPDPQPSFISASAHPDLAAAFVDAMIAGARREASEAIRDAVEAGLGIEDLYLEVFQPALREVGRLWQTSQISVAQEHLATATTQLIMAQLYPKIFDLPPAKHGTLVATCVSGNLHEVGIRMLADVFSLAGWETHLLGANAPSGSVVDLAVDQQADVIAISATLVEHLGDVEALIKLFRERTDALILVGGVPFLSSPGLAEAIGADGTANDARGALMLANTLVGQ